MARQPATEETRALMRAAHRRRWEANRDRYLEANVRGAECRRGSRYLRPRNSHIVNQYGIVYESIADACEKHGLTDRLVRLVLEGKRTSTGGFSFQLVSKTYKYYARRRALRNNS